MNIRTKLSFLLVGISAVAIFFISTLHYYNTKEALTDRTLHHLQAVASLVESRIQDALDRNVERLKLTTSRTEMRLRLSVYEKTREPADKLNLQKTLDDTKASVGDFLTLWIMDPDGQVILSTDKTSEGKRYADQDFFIRGEKGYHTSGIFQDEHQHSLMYLSAPLELDGKLLGVIVVKAKADIITTITRDYTGLGETGEALLIKKDVNGDAVIITARRFETDVMAKKRISINRMEIASVQALGKDDKLHINVLDYREKPVLAATRYLESVDWGLVVKMDKAEAFRPVNDLEKATFVVAMITLLLVMLTALAVAKNISDPINALHQGTEIISTGNLGHKVATNARDEIGQLSRAFDQMVANLKAMTASRDDLDREVQERKRIESELRERTHELNERVKELRCLYDLSNLIEQPGITLNQVFEAITKRIPFGWRYSEITCVKIVFENFEYKTENFKTSAWKQSAPIAVRGEKIGSIEVYYLEEKPGAYEGPFTKDERILLNALAERLGRVAERHLAEQKQIMLMKELESTNKDLSDFAYVVSHDLKAPLRGIASLANWIINDYKDKLDDEGKENLRLIGSRVQRMNDLIDGILRYSKLGRTKEQKELVDLNTLVNEVIQLIDPPKNIRITIAKKLPMLFCDQTYIRQVFQNLLGNAIRYSDKPESVITINCEEIKNEWEISVADNGIGIDDKYYRKIFELFQTLRPRDESESTGIGLTIVKKIVELYGGRIWVESKVGEGSTFFFTLPK